MNDSANLKPFANESSIMSQRMLTASCVAVALLGVLVFKLINDTDVFWQIKLGQIMLEEGRIPRFDRFTYTHAGAPAPPIGWLAQTLFASLYGLGGWRLTRAVHQFALVGSLLVAAATCRRDLTSSLSVAVAMAIAFLVILSNGDLRPQSFGLLCFAILLALARGPRPLRVKLVVAAPLLVVWQNMHPSVVIGVAALCALAAADFAERKNGQSNLCSSVVLALLALALQFATPLGYQILEISQDNLRISRDVLRVPEWLHPWDPAIAFEAIFLYWIAFLGSLFAILWFRNRLSMRDKMLFLVMTGLSLFAARFVIFWAVASIPLWAELVERLIPRGMFEWARGGQDLPAWGDRSWMLPAFALAIVVGLHPANFRPIFRSEISRDGVRALRIALPGAARVFNHYRWAGPLILDGSPAWQLAVDGRLYLFKNTAEWRFIEDANTGRISLDEVERIHHPDAFFLYPAESEALIRSLEQGPRWRTCFRGPTCVAFVRAR
jgi:hypothetical protein